VRVAAPTGAAAVLLGGSTLHSLLGLRRGVTQSDDDDGKGGASLSAAMILRPVSMAAEQQQLESKTPKD